MKCYAIILSVLFTIISCGQAPTKKQKTLTQNKIALMNNNDILEGDPYLKKLQKYDYEPQYEIKILGQTHEMI